MKRYRYKCANYSGMRVSVGKLDGCVDLVVDRNDAEKSDANLMFYHLMNGRFSWDGKRKDDSLIVELIKRGYDITTLDIKIKKLDKTDSDAVTANEILLKKFEKSI